MPALCQRLTAAFSSMGRDYEVVFSVDASPDRSFVALKEQALKDPHFKILLLRRNMGYDNAIMAGLNYARGKWVVIMDDDLQHSPEDIPSLLAAAEKGNDVVYAGFPAKRQSLIKNIGSWFNDATARVIINKPRSIYLSPFKVVSREVVEEIIKHKGPFPYIDGLIFQNTSSIAQIPVEHHERAEGEGNHGLMRSARIWLNFCTAFSIIPLRASVWFGFFISAASFLYAAHVLHIKLTRGVTPEGWVTVVLGISLLGGIQLISLGILGEYIGRMYMNLNQAPQFVVREAVNCDKE